LYFDPVDKNYHVGFGSFYLPYVFKWLSEEFEIEDELTVDAVPVVRCKDCKHKLRTVANGVVICREKHGMVQPSLDDFCSYGERRDDDVSD